MQLQSFDIESDDEWTTEPLVHVRDTLTAARPNVVPERDLSYDEHLQLIAFRQRKREHQADLSLVLLPDIGTDIIVHVTASCARKGTRPGACEKIIIHYTTAGTDVRVGENKAVADKTGIWHTHVRDTIVCTAAGLHVGQHAWLQGALLRLMAQIEFGEIVLLAAFRFFR